MSRSHSLERYHRQIILKELGEEGQQKLLAAKVLVIGAGGLGCPVLQYLAAAGVGTLGIVDQDTVALTNLHRQVLYTVNDVGQQKAVRAAALLQQMNPDIRIVPYPVRLTVQNAWELLEAYDLIVDASDNFPTRYLVNDACVLLQKPLVYGAVSRFEGQVAVFNAAASGLPAVNYRDLFPHPPQEGEVASCAVAGVLGVLPGIIGSVQAGEAIKYITGIGSPLINRLQTFSLLSNEWYTWELAPAPGTAALLPKDREAFRQMDYEGACAPRSWSELTADEFNRLRNGERVTIIDVREKGEQPLISEFAHRQIPLSQLAENLAEVEGDTIIVLCQSGGRSKQAARLLAEAFASRTIYSLQGGILGWKEIAKKEQHG